jgi:hypothetical protein
VKLSGVWIVFLFALALVGCANSFSDDSHYVSLGPRTGYYIVRPDSRLFDQLGLYDAPWIDTADWLRHGYGADALAFQFNRRGILVAAPAYIVQETPNHFYTSRIGSLARGHAGTQEVEALFGRGHETVRRPDGFTWYYALPVYNPFEDFGSDRR